MLCVDIKKKNSQSKKIENPLLCSLTPIEGYDTTGLLTFTEAADNGKLTVAGQLNHLPLMEELTIKVMEYGDLSSLVVEYPDYNSLGLSLMPVTKLTTRDYTVESKKFQEVLSLPQGLALSDLAGRAVIVTLKEGDLVAFGILVNETQAVNSKI